MAELTAITAAPEWRAAIQQRDLPMLAIARYRRVLVVAAHPDDETLGVGGTVAALHENGARVSVAIATDGEAAFPEQDEKSRTELGRTRRAELRRALDTQGLTDVDVRWAGLPDSELGEHIDAFTAWLRPMAADVDLCLAPWSLDPHPDHRAAGLAARSAAPVQAEVWWYPIWLWPWHTPTDTDLPWRHASRHLLTERQRNGKRAGIAEFVSQLTPGPAGAAPIVAPEVIEHFTGDTEVLFRAFTMASTPVERFSSLYRHTSDPWGTRHQEYERRKRAVTLACLPRVRYRRGLDAGCGSGALTEQLAGSCTELLAMDAVDAAVRATAKALEGHHGATAIRASVPADFPAGPFDLLVFSEILYYLDDTDLTATLDAAAAALEPGGDLIAVDWRPAANDAPRDAQDAHRVLLARPEWRELVAHREPEFLLHVVRRR